MKKRHEQPISFRVRRSAAFFYVGGLLFLAGSIAKADFSVEEPAVTPSPYGQGQSARFTKAIQGGEPMSSEDEAWVARELPDPLTNRYYGRISMNSGSLGLAAFSNKSASVYSASSLSTQKWTVKQKGGLELAAGYAMSDFRVELEGLLNKKLTLSSSNFFAGSQDLAATVTSRTFLLNAYYDWTELDPILPYLMGSVGVSMNSTQSGLAGASLSASKTKFGLAYGAGIGIRTRLPTRFLSRLLLDVGARYTLLGSVQLAPQPGMLFKSKLTMPAFRAGLVFLF